MTNSKMVTVELTAEMIENLKMVLECADYMDIGLVAYCKGDLDSVREARMEVSKGVQFIKNLVA